MGGQGGQPLTDVKLQALKRKIERGEISERERIRDGAVGGLFLTVGAMALVWRVDYRVHGSRTRRTMTIGRYPDWSLQQARAKAREVKRAAGHGKDLGTERQSLRTAVTVGELLTEYEDIEVRHKKSRGEIMRILNKDLPPAFRRMRVAEVTRRNVVLLLDKVKSRAPTVASHLQAYLVRLLNFAAERGHLEVNPLLGMKRPPPKRSRERILSHDELRAFWEALDRLSGAGIERGPALALKLILATGLRPGEVVGGRWDEVDGDLWNIPAERMKTTRGEPKPHEVPLSPIAARLLNEAQSRAGDSPYMFPSSRTERAIRRDALSHAIRRNALGDFTPHDLRRTVRSGLAALAVHAHIAERVLAHKQAGMEAVYNQHDYRAEKQDALGKWGRKLAEIVGQPVKKSTVVRLRV